MVYEVLFFDRWGAIPAYYLIGSVEGNVPEQALSANLEQITQEIRRSFDLSEGEISDRQIQETIYVLRDNGLVSVRDAGSLENNASKIQH
jgi:hypothetical protein